MTLMDVFIASGEIDKAAVRKRTVNKLYDKYSVHIQITAGNKSDPQIFVFQTSIFG